MMTENKLTSLKAQQQQTKLSKEEEISPPPEYIQANFQAAKKLEGNKALTTGGGSGIGKAVASINSS